MPDQTMVVADAANHVIRAIRPDGSVTTLAGRPGVAGASDGEAEDATFNVPSAVACQAGRVFVADSGNAVIRLVENGIVSTFAGRAQRYGGLDGLPHEASFVGPVGIVSDIDGTLYVSDSTNHTVRRIAPDGQVTTIAGLAGYPGHRDGMADQARLNTPRGLAIDPSGTLYVADSENHVIRVIDRAGVVRTLAGTPGVPGYANGSFAATRFDRPVGVALLTDRSLVVVDANNHVLRHLSAAGESSLLAGVPGSAGYGDGVVTSSKFHYPFGIVATASDELLVADMLNHRVRSIDAKAARRRGVRR